MMDNDKNEKIPIGEHVGFWFSRKQFPDLIHVERFAKTYPKLYGRAVERGGELYFFKQDHDESDVIRRPLPGLEGITALFAKEIKSEDGKVLKTVDILDVEVAAVGLWPSCPPHDFTVEELVAMVENQNDIDAPIKFGHEDDGATMRASGLPSIGWVKNLRILGEKLIADLVDVPQKVAALMLAGAYKKRSCEACFNWKHPNGKEYVATFEGLALLGGEIPSMSSLRDIDKITELYAASASGDRTASRYLYSVDDTGTKIVAKISTENNDGGVDMADTNRVEELTRENEGLKAEISELKKVTVTAARSTEELTEKNKTLAAQRVELEAERDRLQTIITAAKANDEKAAAERKDAEDVEFAKIAARKQPPAVAEDVVEGFKATADPEKRKTILAKWQSMEDNPALVNETLDLDGEDGKPGDAADDTASDKKIVAHCKANGLNPNDARDYANAAMAVLKARRSSEGLTLSE